MSYRTSSYDPRATTLGPPARPYNRTQWFGVSLDTVGAIVIGLYWAGQVGWIEPVLGSPAPGFLLLGAGAILLHSRRGPGRVMTRAEQRQGLWWVFGSLFVGGLIVAAIVLIAGVS
ncbi:hypothetical protein GCM10022280_21990 [Sphingomonas swuensis]|uniref:Uncharacterized protein n=1 Tax=Sphingomonas swuensis TaxID=977800 RepID=A0ABP7T4R7_9SPHN